MKAVVVEYDAPNYELAMGQEIDVLGFAFDRSSLMAIWRDDEGYIWPIDVRHIRMLPRISRDYVLLNQAEYDALAHMAPT